MLKIPKAKSRNWTYDDWLDFFRSVPTDELLASQNELRKMSVECYAAAVRWIDIIKNPAKMDKLYSARLKAESEADIMDIAVGDDDEAFYEALIRENVQQLNGSNISAQEAARLTQNINIFRKELREIRSRKPKKGTVLEKVLEKAATPPKSKNSAKPRKKKASKTPSKASEKVKTVKVSSGKEKPCESQSEA